MDTGGEFYKMVPKTFRENLTFRDRLLSACHYSPSLQQAVMQICKEDVLFWLSAFCIAEGTPVVTDRGLVPIESVTDADKVWDGENWVSTGGALCRGVKNVIDVCGVKMTSEHKVWTKYGWRQAGEGYAWKTCRFPDSFGSGTDCEQKCRVVVPVRLRSVDGRAWRRSEDSRTDILRMSRGQMGLPQHVGYKHIHDLVEHDRKMHQPEQLSISSLWWSRDFGVRTLDEVQEFHRGHGFAARKNEYRPHRQRRELLSRELPLGHESGTSQQYLLHSSRRDLSWNYDDFRGSKTSRYFSKDDGVPREKWDAGGGSLLTSEPQERVYDLLNCGPHHAFTVVTPDGHCRRVSNCWLVEPRPRFDDKGRQLPKAIPFIPWDHQEPAIKTIKENLGLRDIGVYKSRGEGLSWISVLLAEHDWIFEDLAKVGLVSSTELKADDPGNLDSLLAKAVWNLERLPTWMVGEKDRDWKRIVSGHSLINLRNGSQINAFAATSDTGRAGRYKWFLADELSFWDIKKGREFMESIRASTDCRFAVSTPNGSVGAFYDMIHVPSSVVKVRIHWTQNNFRNRGLYKIIDGRPTPVDGKNSPMPREYIEPSEEIQNMYSRLRAKGFRLEGRIRSPWYDQECDKGDATPQSIAQEYDLDFGGSAYHVFPVEFTEKAMDAQSRPLHEGVIDFNPETLEIDYTDRPDAGECKMWVELDAAGKPPVGTYVLGCDIGSGLGGSYSSNSVCQVVNRATGEQVLEWASNMIEPGDFAKLCVAIAKWFYDGYLGWEANFGGGFTRRVIALGYGNVYYRTVHWRAGRKKQKEIGWWTDDRSKELMFSDMYRKVRTGEVVFHSADLLRECGEYVRSGPKSSIVHELTVNTSDESSRGKAHGDRVIAFALAIQLLEDRPMLDRDLLEQKSGPPPVNTLAWRVQQWERQDAPLNEWEDGTLGDVARHGAGNGFLD